MLSRPWHRAFCYTSLFVLTVIAHGVQAQSLPIPGSGNGSLSGTMVDDREVRARAVGAFDATVDNRLRKALADVPPRAKPKPDFTALAAQIKQAFRDEVDESLDRLRGDGVLEAGEVAEELGDERSDLINRLNDGLAALRDGSPPPPLRQESASWPAHALALGRYTLIERNQPKDWALFLGIWLVASALAYAIKWMFDTAETRLRKRGARIWSLVAGAAGGPSFAAVLLAGLAGAFGDIWVPGIASGAMSQAFALLMWLTLGWLLWALCKPAALSLTLLFRHTYHHQIGHHFSVIVHRVLLLLVLMGGTAVLARVIGGAGLGGTLAGLGLMGVAIALVLKGTLEHVVASFTIFGDKPFVVGDTLNYDGMLGVVEDIGFRSTRFRRFDGELVCIPNDNLIDEDIINVSERRWIRREFGLSLVYGTAPDKVQEALDIITDLLESSGQMHPDYAPQVLFENYGAYDLQLLVYYWYAPPDYWAARAFHSQLNLDVLRRFADAELEFAFPTQTTVLHSPSDNTTTLADGDKGTRTAKAHSKDERSAAADQPADTEAGAADADG